MSLQFKSAVVALCLLAIPAQAQTSVPLYDKGLDLSYSELISQYAALNAAKLTTNPKFLDAYAQANMCDEWKLTHNNEFDAPATLEKAKQAVTALKPKEGNRYSLSTAVQFGQYDAAKGGFPFKLIDNPDAKLSFPLKAAVAEGSSAECTPTSPAWPDTFLLQVKNPGVFDGIPMKPEEGRAFLQKYPNRQVYLMLTFAISKWGNINSSRALSVDADIVDAAIIGPTGQLDYHFDKAYFDNAARTLAEAQAKRAVEPVPFSLIYFDSWADHLSGKGPDTLADGTKLRDMIMDVGAFYLRPALPAQNLPAGSVTLGGWPKDDLIAETQYQGSRRIAIVNASDFAGALPLSEEDAARIAPTTPNGPFNASLRILALPVKFEQLPNSYSTLSVFVKEIQIIPAETSGDPTPIVLKAKSVLPQ